MKSGYVQSAEAGFSGGRKRNSAELNIPKSTVFSVAVMWKKAELFLELAMPPSCGFRGRRALAMQERLRDASLNVLEGSSQKPD